MRFKANLSELFGGNNVILQINSWGDGGTCQGTYRIYNITDVSVVKTLTNTAGSTTPTIYESTSFAPTNAVKEYAFEHERNAGSGSDKTRVRGAILRRA
jgi:hypothetical protein